MDSMHLQNRARLKHEPCKGHGHLVALEARRALTFSELSPRTRPCSVLAASMPLTLWPFGEESSTWGHTASSSLIIRRVFQPLDFQVASPSSRVWRDLEEGLEANPTGTSSRPFPCPGPPGTAEAVKGTLQFSCAQNMAREFMVVMDYTLAHVRHPYTIRYNKVGCVACCLLPFPLSEWRVRQFRSRVGEDLRPAMQLLGSLTRKRCRSRVDALLTDGSVVRRSKCLSQT